MKSNRTTNEASYNGHPINTGTNGEYSCYEDILQKIHEQFELMTEAHNKVLFVRFDLHYPAGYGVIEVSQHISYFFRRMVEYYSRKKIDLQYIWVREVGLDNLGHHYHCAMLFDGNKIQNYYPITMKASAVWGRVLDVEQDGLVDYCDSMENGLMMRRPSSKAEGDTFIQQQQSYSDIYDQCFFWASYLAKVNQKNNIPLNMRSFGTSRM